MGHGQSREELIKAVYKGLFLLAAVTVIEVLFSLFGKGHLMPGVSIGRWLTIAVAVILICLSLYKAYFIVYKFMHMKDEVKSLSATVLLPMLLLVWAIIAFFQDGNAWGKARAEKADAARIEIQEGIRPLMDKKAVKVQPAPVESHGDNHDHGEDDHSHDH